MWAERESQHMDFNDLRLNQRLFKILEDFTRRPKASIPEACGSWSSTKAAYRFFNNEEVKVEKITKGFVDSTIERMQTNSHKTYLFQSDSTNIVFSSHKALKGIGVLRNQRARGLNLHTTLVSTEGEVTLGIVNQHCWGRDDKDYGQRAMRAKKPIEEKESYRWIESFQAAQKALPDDTQGIFIGDRGSDIYELFLQPRKENMHTLIRVLHNRTLTNKERLFSHIASTDCMGLMQATITRSDKRKERIANLEIRYQKITLNPPLNKKTLPPVVLTIILANEITEDANVKEPINWKLLTTLPIESLEQAIHAVTTYTKRWLIERYHYVLKQGCLVEKLQFEDAECIKKAIAVYTIVACRLMHLTYLSRKSPNLPCTKIFNEDEWKALYCYAYKIAKPPLSPPSLREAVFMLASIGGFLGRKSDGDPGVKVLWRGLKLLEGAVVMYSLLKGKKDVGNA